MSLAHLLFGAILATAAAFAWALALAHRSPASVAAAATSSLIALCQIAGLHLLLADRLVPYLAFVPGAGHVLAPTQAAKLLGGLVIVLAAAALLGLARQSRRSRTDDAICHVHERNLALLALAAGGLDLAGMLLREPAVLHAAMRALEAVAEPCAAAVVACADASLYRRHAGRGRDTARRSEAARPRARRGRAAGSPGDAATRFPARLCLC
ncbi:MAG: hypothetical protein KDE35_08980 [Geminicoccaceae bacterium]|nr:hypothetical protein [Geminicoccaceae bacterium]